MLAFFFFLLKPTSAGRSQWAGPPTHARPLSLILIGRDVRGGKESSPSSEFARPPMLITSIRDRDDVASSEFQLAVFLQVKTNRQLVEIEEIKATRIFINKAYTPPYLGRKVVEGLDQELVWHHFFEFDIL